MQRSLSENARSRHLRPLGHRGAGLVEYALLLALISIVCLSALNMFGTTNGGSINQTASTYGSAVN